MNYFELDDVYRNEEYETLTLYFKAPVDFCGVSEKYPDAESAEISLEFSYVHNFEPALASVMVSPTKNIGGCDTDYDWFGVDLSDFTINELYDIYRETVLERAKNAQVNTSFYA